MASQQPKRPNTTPAKGGLEVRENPYHISNFRGSYVNNRTRTRACKFTAPGFDFVKAYEDAGFGGYTAGNQPSPKDSEGKSTYQR